jgi:hypothetical protein
MRPELLNRCRRGRATAWWPAARGGLPRRLLRSPIQGVTGDVGWSSIPYDGVLAFVMERGEPSASAAGGRLFDVNAVGSDDPFCDVAWPMTTVAQPAAGHSPR